jgi:hypothetical protein
MEIYIAKYKIGIYIKIMVFYVLTLRSLVSAYRRFGEHFASSVRLQMI